MHSLVQSLFYLGCSTIVVAQYYDPTTTPVPILKQINRHNEDGSYNYGYEAADGSYKIESKYPSGEIYGKYGFIDADGKLREVEYGASSRAGFQPIGTDINVPPSPDLTKSDNNDPMDDGQYREDPTIYHRDPKFTNGEVYNDKRPPSRSSSYQDQSIRPRPDGAPTPQSQIPQYPQPSPSLAIDYETNSRPSGYSDSASYTVQY